MTNRVWNKESQMLEGSDPEACKTLDFTKLGMEVGPALSQVPGKVVPAWHPVLCSLQYEVSLPCMSVWMRV